jgi:3-deoxy-manno-octulosonate cytidylyltransferase (CMP-KDO synthetase)
MIWHVYEQTQKCLALTSVVVATDDDRIRSAAQRWNIPVVMTRSDHPSGTDRVLEAALKLNCSADAVIVNIQGDEPTLDPAMLSELIQPFSASEVLVTTAARELKASEAADPDQVKVVFAKDGRALYFSRSTIPYHRHRGKNNYFGHIGVYAFRMNALKKFATFSRSSLEITEKLEQLRLLENNIPIHVVVTKCQSIGVDRPEDIKTVSRMLLEKQRR